ncbi:hypothetical protein Q5752_004606 [Cryptotrichosporon argae]
MPESGSARGIDGRIIVRLELHRSDKRSTADTHRQWAFAAQLTLEGETDYTHLSKRELYFSFSLVTSLFFLWGLSYGLIDVLNAHFLAIFGLTKTQSTLLQFAYFVAYLVVAPPMGMFMRRYRYKKGIHIGLGLFSTGAVLFWPSAKFAHYGMFVAFTFVAASGLATLEVAANSYIVVLGPPRHAALRLTLAQSFNGIATVLGPIIAAHTFFNGANATSLATVQYVYLALSVFALLLNIGVAFAKLPEVRQVVVADDGEKATLRGFFRQYHTIFGVISEWFYVDAQVAVASFTVYYVTEQPGIRPPLSSATGSNLYSGCQGAFTLGRFAGVFYLRWIDPSFALFASGVFLCIFSILTSTVNGYGGIVCLYFVFFFENICYPVIFSVATADLGTYQKIGAGAVALGVTHRSYLVALTGFVPLTLYGLGMWLRNSRKHGHPLSIFAKHTILNPEDMQREDGSAPSAIVAPTPDEKAEEVFVEHRAGRAAYA